MMTSDRERERGWRLTNAQPWVCISWLVIRPEQPGRRHSRLQLHLRAHAEAHMRWHRAREWERAREKAAHRHKPTQDRNRQAEATQRPRSLPGVMLNETSTGTVSQQSSLTHNTVMFLGWQTSDCGAKQNRAQHKNTPFCYIRSLLFHQLLSL